MGEWIEREDYRKKILYDEEDLNSRGVLVQLVEVESGNKVGPHYHKNQTEVYNIQRGNAILGIDDMDFKAEKGDTLICEPGQVHYVINDSSEKFRLLVIKTNYEEGDTFWGTK
ncbi:hypothetical protein AKJ56_00565 [candidate division MSBL1 archaeon SCGC-AAA382N08]|uniref:Cupin type-2 domain-containing protein n=1 Tax=candidate division MSBL1 archaeon SCGC-AAA382N08 TaxID=1698285 RepID=A0A133VQF4_9EURY|nr:hypothetical protein AKJ56_00565 [candidate division MSBL1 archaeon SCGC-AAA382N08]